MDTLQLLRNYMSTETSAGEDILTSDESENLLAKGIMDSMALLNVVSFMEREFKIGIRDEDINKSNFRDLKSMAAFVERKRSGEDG